MLLKELVNFTEAAPLERKEYETLKGIVIRLRHSLAGRV